MKGKTAAEVRQVKLRRPRFCWETGTTLPAKHPGNRLSNSFCSGKLTPENTGSPDCAKGVCLRQVESGMLIDQWVELGKVLAG
jgi:hypothetical protein